MKNALMSLILLSVAASSAFASDKSLGTQLIESTLKPFEKKVDCSMEDFSCQRVVLDMAGQE
ncbi:MAG TPA: hypothetical protein VN132_13665, partial [Bdellovibrio sp.]|nr:hypothetical protein [Bdellovibrio sp.]